MQQADRWNTPGGRDQGEYQEKEKKATKDTEGSYDSSGKTPEAPSEPSEAREQIVKFLMTNATNQNATWDHKDASENREWYFI